MASQGRETEQWREDERRGGWPKCNVGKHPPIHAIHAPPLSRGRDTHTRAKFVSESSLKIKPRIKLFNSQHT
jgi:hypothetical protein